MSYFHIAYAALAPGAKVLIFRGNKPSLQELDVDVGAEADVVGQIPAGMIGVFVDDDLVGIPEPAVTEGVVVRGDAEIEAAEPEARRAASAKAPPMAGAETAVEMAVFPGVVEVVVGGR
jgi:hypothetical protein